MKKKKIMAILVVLIILAGIIVLFTKGFNKDISYQKATKIEVNIPKGYEKEEIEQIANEAFIDSDIMVQEIEKTNQVVSIRVNSYTEEELNNFKSKISERYNIEQDKLTVYEIEVPATRISTIVKPYVFSVSLTTILSLIYIALRNIKRDAGKKVLELICGIIAMAGLYFSIIVIARIPVNEYVMPLALALYVATTLVVIGKINNE